MKKNLSPFLIIIICVTFLVGCYIPTIQFQNEPVQPVENALETPTDQNSSNPIDNTTPTLENTNTPTFTQPPPTPSFTSTTGIPMLTLGGNFYCNVGPGANYNRIIIYPSGTQLKIIGWNGGGWYLVEMLIPQPPRTSCWIGGGVPSGNLEDVPIPTPMPVVPAHDPTNWLNVVYLTCPELSTYQWTWGGSSSGEYASLTPIIGINNATIVYTEFHPICPGFTPFLKVPIHNLDSGNVIGYLSCSEMSTQRWYWNIFPGRWLSSTSLFGSNRATYTPLDLSMNCPSMTTTKVVPVHNGSWDIIGFLGCPELDTYIWNTGTNSGEYNSSTPLFGSVIATIYYEEYNPACPSFTP